MNYVVFDKRDRTYLSDGRGELWMGSWTKSLRKAKRFLDDVSAHSSYSGMEGDCVVRRIVNKRSSGNGLCFKALRAANLQRLKSTAKFAHCRDWSLSDWFLALTGEVGEAANIAKKINRGDFTFQEARADLAKELADIQTYLDLVAEKAGIDLGAATVEKFNEVSERVGSPVRLAA